MASLLSIPREMRFLIYGSVVRCTGVLQIYAQYDIADQVNQDTIALMHVCDNIRTEVQDYFYKNQAFRFASSQAIGKFLDKIGPYHTSLITNVHIGPHLSRRLLGNFVTETLDVLRERITGLERLTIEKPQYDYIVHISPNRNGAPAVLRPGPKTKAILSACPRLAKGNIIKKLVLSSLDEEDENGQEFLLFVPKDEKFPAIHDVQVGHTHRPDGHIEPVFVTTFYKEVVQLGSAVAGKGEEGVT